MHRFMFVLIALFVSLTPAAAREKGIPGQFDYYVLSLSWSPTWCGGKAGKADADQCGGARRYGFVVHGLWPQYAKGGYPAQCTPAQPVPTRVVEDMLPVMPSRKLILHEWSRHGTCDGGTAQDYFARTRQAFDKVKLPPALQKPEHPQSFSVEQVERMFADANPGLGRKGVAVMCRGNQAAEIRLCLDRDLGFRACGRDVRPRCKGGVAHFPAAR